uniref:Ribosomal protein S3 n=1 Tax=Phaeocystis globosa TaxID=33658 RepID=A0A8A1RX25_9EUKA|nr:ribosomal protein S3 [Phaeocystis globosa]QST19712.1 ribosomal protein S3 [Phaeocystis globosa]
MGQKISATSLRVSTKTAWNSVWSEDNKTYSIFLFKDLEIKKYIKIISDRLAIKFYQALVKPQNGALNIEIKNISGNVFHKLPRSLSFLESFIFNTRAFLSLKLGLNFNFWKSKLLFSNIPARFFSEFISLQIKLSPKRRSKNFKYGLYYGIKSTLSYYYNNRTKNFVSGIKVVCQGKWSKTSSGRSQKIFLDLGRLNTQSCSHFVDSHISTINTKFGVCSVKVSISYNIVDNRF